jgi:hypothetical protein
MQVGSRYIPREIWSLVFRSLDPYSVCTAASVCKLFYGLSNADDVWKSIRAHEGYTTGYYPDTLTVNKEIFKYFYENTLNQPIYILNESSSTWPCHSQKISYTKPRKRSSPVPETHEFTLSVLCKDGQNIEKMSRDPLFDDAFCPNCRLLLRHSSDINIISRYELSYYEVMQEAGELNYLEIYCNKCKNYCKWTHDHSYYSSYY